MKQAKGILFDFNGTLLFDTPFHEEAWRIYAQRLCGRAVTDEEFRDRVHGRTNAEILRYFVGAELSPEDIDRHAEAKEALYREICLRHPDRFRLADGAEQLLDYGRAHGIPMAIATSSGKSNVDFYREQLHMNRWFGGNTFIYNDGSMRSKPAPDIYLMAARAVGLPPEECVVYEDMPSGVAAAKAAGAGQIVAVASALSPNYLAALDGVDRVIADYTRECEQYK